MTKWWNKKWPNCFRKLKKRPDLVVLEGHSCSKGCGFKSRYNILDGHFFTLFLCKNCIVCLKRPKIIKKRGQGWPIFWQSKFLIKQVFENSSKSQQIFFYIFRLSHERLSDHQPLFKSLRTHKVNFGGKTTKFWPKRRLHFGQKTFKHFGVEVWTFWASNTTTFWSKTLQFPRNGYFSEYFVSPWNWSFFKNGPFLYFRLFNTVDS